MWRSELLTELTWEAPAKRGFDHSDTPDHTRCLTYRAPSWSWASLDGRIKRELYHGQFFPVAEICDLNIELESPEASFGKIKAAWMEVEAPLKVLSPSEDKALKFKNRFPPEDEDSTGSFHDLEFDLKSDGKCEDGELGCLYLWRHAIDPGDSEQENLEHLPEIAGGLIIARSVFHKEYRRVGKFMASVSWFDGVPRRRVHLV